MADGQSDFEKAGMKISSTNVYAGGSSGGSSPSTQPKAGTPTSIYQAGGQALGNADAKTGNRTIYDANYNAVGTLTKSGQVLVNEAGQKYYSSYQKSGSTSHTPEFQKEAGGEIKVVNAEVRPSQIANPNQSMQLKPTTRQIGDYTNLEMNTQSEEGMKQSSYYATSQYLYGRNYKDLSPEFQEQVRKVAETSKASYYKGMKTMAQKVASGELSSNPYYEGMTEYKTPEGKTGSYFLDYVENLKQGFQSNVPQATQREETTKVSTAGFSSSGMGTLGGKLSKDFSKPIAKASASLLATTNVAGVSVAGTQASTKSTSSLDVSNEAGMTIIKPKGYSQSWANMFNKNEQPDYKDVSEKAELVKKYYKGMEGKPTYYMTDIMGKGRDTVIIKQGSENLAGKKLTMEVQTPLEIMTPQGALKETVDVGVKSGTMLSLTAIPVSTLKNVKETITTTSKETYGLMEATQTYDANTGQIITTYSQPVKTETMTSSKLEGLDKIGITGHAINLKLDLPEGTKADDYYSKENLHTLGGRQASSMVSGIMERPDYKGQGFVQETTASLVKGGARAYVQAVEGTERWLVGNTAEKGGYKPLISAVIEGQANERLGNLIKASTSTLEVIGTATLPVGIVERSVSGVVGYGLSYVFEPNPEERASWFKAGFILPPVIGEAGTVAKGVGTTTPKLTLIQAGQKFTVEAIKEAPRGFITGATFTQIQNPSSSPIEQAQTGVVVAVSSPFINPLIGAVGGGVGKVAGKIASPLKQKFVEMETGKFTVDEFKTESSRIEVKREGKEGYFAMEKGELVFKPEPKTFVSVSEQTIGEFQVKKPTGQIVGKEEFKETIISGEGASVGIIETKQAKILSVAETMEGGKIDLTRTTIRPKDQFVSIYKYEAEANIIGTKPAGLQTEILATGEKGSFGRPEADIVETTLKLKEVNVASLKPIQKAMLPKIETKLEGVVYTRGYSIEPAKIRTQADQIGYYSKLEAGKVYTDSGKPRFSIDEGRSIKEITRQADTIQPLKGDWDFISEGVRYKTGFKKGQINPLAFQQMAEMKTAQIERPSVITEFQPKFKEDVRFSKETAVVKDRGQIKSEVLEGVKERYKVEEMTKFKDEFKNKFEDKFKTEARFKVNVSDLFKTQPRTEMKPAMKQEMRFKEDVLTKTETRMTMKEEIKTGTGYGYTYVVEDKFTPNPPKPDTKLEGGSNIVLPPFIPIILPSFSDTGEGSYKSQRIKAGSLKSILKATTVSKRFKL